MAAGWKPGDVGSNYGNRVFRTKDGWHFVDGPGIPDYEYTVRPLVVIDPEDREQVEHLTKALIEAAEHDGNTMVAYNGIHPDTTARALSGFADQKLPKPAEPTGLGAVVRDSDGNAWVRHHIADNPAAPWCGETGVGRSWRHVDAVAVLSEGVQP